MEPFSFLIHFLFLHILRLNTGASLLSVLDRNANVFEVTPIGGVLEFLYGVYV